MNKLLTKPLTKPLKRTSIGKVFASMASLALLSMPVHAEKMTLSLLASVNPGEAGYASLMDQVKAFEGLHPDVTINVSNSSHDEYFTRLQTLTLSDQLPDLINLWTGQRTSYVMDAGKALDLTPYIERDKLKDKVLPIIFDQPWSKGGIFVLGNNVNMTSIVYANMDILKKVGVTYPKTFKEWEEQAPKIRKAGYYPLVMGNESSWVMQSCLFSAIVGKTAGNAWVDKAAAGQAKFTDKPFMDALDTIVTMRDSGLLPKALNSITTSKSLELFIAGKSAYYIEGAWSVSSFTKAMTPEEVARTQLFALPELNGVANTTSSVAGGSYGINVKLKGTPKADMAWEWIKFYNGFSGQQSVDINIAAGIVPPVKNLKVPDNAPGLLKQLVHFQNTTEHTYVLDAMLKPKGIDFVNNSLQELIANQITPKDFAEKYEAIARQ